MMYSKIVVFAIIAMFAMNVYALPKAGLAPALPLPYAAVAPYATSYNAHTINHAIAAPVAAPLLAPSAPVFAPASPFLPAPAHAHLVGAAPYTAALPAPIAAPAPLVFG